MRITYWLLLYAALGAPQVPTQSPTSPTVEEVKPVGHATLRFTVMNARSKRPVPGAQASIEAQQVTFTDEAGTLRMPVEARDLRVTFSAPGYRTTHRFLAPKDGETLDAQVELEKDIPPVEGPQSVRLCYEVALSRNPNIRGHVILAWRIDAHGAPQDVKLVSSTVHDVGLDQCVLRALKTERFPPLQSSTQRVMFPFLFGETSPR